MKPLRHKYPKGTKHPKPAHEYKAKTKPSAKTKEHGIGMEIGYKGSVGNEPISTPPNGSGRGFREELPLQSQAGERMMMGMDRPPERGFRWRARFDRV